MNLNTLETNITLAAFPERPFKYLLELITALIPISYIFQNKADARGITLIMVLDRFQYQPAEVTRNMLEFIALGKMNMEIRYFTYGTMNDMLMRGNLFYSSYCRSEHCIYQSASPYELIETPETLLARIRAKSLPVIHNGIEKSLNFLAGASAYFCDNKLQLSAFMLHQACEQLFRLIINLSEEKAIKSHQLILLQKTAGFYFPMIRHIFDDRKSKELKWLELLQQAYLGARYDDAYEIEPQQVVYMKEKITVMIEKSAHYLQHW